ncbi:MAG: hypothetical protein ACM3P0_14170 [Acidobacteriota bacterium]
MKNNAAELSKESGEEQFQEYLADLYSLSYLLKYSIISDTYIPNPRLGELIEVTASGQILISKIKELNNSFKEEEIKTALFIKFYHNELLINVDKTDKYKLIELFQQDLLNKNIKFPWVYEHILYDRFNSMFPDCPTELTYKDTEELIENTPQGVFQIRQIIVGPFGFIESDCHRKLIIKRTALLWHCPEPTCKRLHQVRLSTGNSKLFEILELIETICKNNYELSEWGDFFDDINNFNNFFDDFNPQGLPWLLANAFSLAELRTLLNSLFSAHGENIKKKIPKNKIFKSLFKNSSEKITSSLTKAQCLQLILIISNEEIVTALEELIENRKIIIPATEIRIPVFDSIYNWLEISWECSQFGLRASSTSNEIGLLRFKNIVSKIYADDLDDLKWKLRNIDGDTTDDKINIYFHQYDPKKILAELIFSSPRRLQKSFELLKYGKFRFPKSVDEENWLINKILWKMGFEIGIYPNNQEQFWKRLSFLRDKVQAFQVYNENDKEIIRSASVNFFVSLEQVLDQSLSFITWVLLSDHFGGTKFKYEHEEARILMAETLSGKKIQKDSDPIIYNSNGTNTLFPLIYGFNLLSNHCHELLKNDPDTFIRSSEEFPSYYNKTEIQLFPYVHKHCIFDLKIEDVIRLLNILEEITTELCKANIANIRNRTQHSRPESEFPSQKEMESSLDSVASIITKMENSGIFPLTYLFSESLSDKYNRSVYKLTDYRGREISVYKPSSFDIVHMPFGRNPLVFVPCLHIMNSCEILRFEFTENSDFKVMWKDFPSN